MVSSSSNNTEIASSSAPTQLNFSSTKSGDTNSLTVRHAYDAYVSRLSEHPKLGPIPQNLRLHSEHAKQIIKEDKESQLTTAIKNHYGDPPTSLLSMMGNQAVWKKHLKTVCADYVKHGYQVQGHADLYVAGVENRTRKNAWNTLALRFGLNDNKDAIKSIGLPQSNEKAVAEQALAEQRAIETIDLLSKPTDVKTQTAALSFFVHRKSPTAGSGNSTGKSAVVPHEPVALLSPEIRAQFLAQMNATQSNSYPPELQRIRAHVVLTLWEHGGTGRERPADILRTCLANKNKPLDIEDDSGQTSLDLYSPTGPGLTDKDLSDDLHEVLGHLTHVTTVDLGFHELTYIPPALQKMTKLESLDMYGNRFPNLGSVIEFVGHASSLNSMDISSMYVIKEDCDAAKAYCEQRGVSLNADREEYIIDTSTTVKLEGKLPFLLHYSLNKSRDDVPLHLIRITMSESDDLNEKFTRSVNKSIHAHFETVLADTLARQPELGAILYRGDGWNEACFLLLPHTRESDVPLRLRDLQDALAKHPSKPNKDSEQSIPLGIEAGIATYHPEKNDKSRSSGEVEKLCTHLMSRAHKNMSQVAGSNTAYDKNVK